MSVSCIEVSLKNMYGRLRQRIQLCSGKAVIRRIPWGIQLKVICWRRVFRL